MTDHDEAAHLRELLAAAQNRNRTLLMRAEGAEKDAATIPDLARAADEFRSLYFATLEKLHATSSRLAAAQIALEQAGVRMVPAPPEKPLEQREQENDQRTGKAERGFT